MDSVKLFDPADEPSFDVSANLRMRLSVRVTHSGREMKEYTLPGWAYLTPEPGEFIEGAGKPEKGLLDGNNDRSELTRLCIDLGDSVGWIQYANHKEATNAVERLVSTILDAVEKLGDKAEDDTYKGLAALNAAQNFYYSE